MGTDMQDGTHPSRQERGRQRMESLLRAAEEVFAEVGFERATTNLIAARASLSAGTLYFHRRAPAFDALLLPATIARRMGAQSITAPRADAERRPAGAH
jgi:DNA-binding transcriptional regulator YbjK